MQAVLQRVGRAEAGTDKSVVFDVQRLPEGVLERVRSGSKGIQTLVVDPYEASVESSEGAPRFGVFPTANGVCFRQPASLGTRLAVSGEFNQWDADGEPMRCTADGFHEVILPLAPGTYRYRLIVDGAPTADPHGRASTEGDVTTCVFELPASS